MDSFDRHKEVSERRFPTLQTTALLGSDTSNPVASYLASANAAFFWVSDALEGMLFWGRPDRADVAMIGGALRANPALLLHPHASLVDMRHLESIDLGVFGELSSILASRREGTRPPVTRQAVLRPEGPVGAIAAAFIAPLTDRSSSRSFGAAHEALDWIGIRDLALFDGLERIRCGSSVPAPLIDGLRKRLDVAPTSKATEVARQFGVSQRTLQRRLRDVGTSYQRETNSARLEVAKRLMRETAHPLKWIALEAGYASAQHFSSSFRKHVGMSPSRWRANRSD